MKKIMSILMSILTFIGCKSKEEKFLDNHEVLFCKTKSFQNFIDKSNIKPEKAWELMANYSDEKKIQQPHLLYFIIDGHYAFTKYLHPKIPETYTGGIWVNGESGQIKEIKEGVFLQAYYKYDWNK